MVSHTQGWRHCSPGDDADDLSIASAHRPMTRTYFASLCLRKAVRPTGLNGTWLFGLLAFTLACHSMYISSLATGKREVEGKERRRVQPPTPDGWCYPGLGSIPVQTSNVQYITALSVRRLEWECALGHCIPGHKSRDRQLRRW